MASNSKNKGKKIATTKKNNQSGQTPVELAWNEIEQIANFFKNEIGKGGNGSVYGGIYNSQAVAVKRYGAAQKSHFQAELSCLTKIHHKNVVNLLGFGEENDFYALVLEWLPKCLADVYKELDWTTTLKIIKQVGEALRVTHKQGFIFVDLKPSNIMLDEDNNAKLIDFGSATAPKTAIKSDTQAYRARPLGMISTLNASEAVDVYSYGYVMEIMLEKSALPEEQRGKNKQKGKGIIKPKNMLHDKLLRPRGCSEKDAMKISDLVRQCKVLKPENRPPLHKVLTSLEELKAESCTKLAR